MSDAATAPRRGVSAAMLASFDLSLDEEIRHAREMLGRHEHDVKRMQLLITTAEARKDAHEHEVERLRVFIAFLDAQKSERQTQGSTIAGGASS